MVATVGEEESAFLGAQEPGLLTIEMEQTAGAEHDGISRRDGPGAARAPTRLLFHR